MHLCFFIKRLLLFGSVSGISLIQQRRNVSKNQCLLDVDRKNVIRKTGLLLTCSPVSLDLFKDLNDVSLYR